MRSDCSIQNGQGVQLGRYIHTTDAEDSDKATISSETGISGIGNFSDLFQELPFCPVGGNKITVKVEAAGTGDVTGGVYITISCDDAEHNEADD